MFKLPENPNEWAKDSSEASDWQESSQATLKVIYTDLVANILNFEKDRQLYLEILEELKEAITK